MAEFATSFPYVSSIISRDRVSAFSALFSPIEIASLANFTITVGTCFSCLVGLGVVALPRALVCHEHAPSVKGLGLSFFLCLAIVPEGNLLRVLLVHRVELPATLGADHKAG